MSETIANISYPQWRRQAGGTRKQRRTVLPPRRVCLVPGAWRLVVLLRPLGLLYQHDRDVIPNGVSKPAGRIPADQAFPFQADRRPAGRAHQQVQKPLVNHGRSLPASARVRQFSRDGHEVNLLAPRPGPFLCQKRCQVRKGVRTLKS